MSKNRRNRIKLENNGAPTSQADDTSFVIGVDPQMRLIKICFNKQVAWIGMDLQTALNMNRTLGANIQALAAVLAQDVGKDTK